MEIYEPGLDDAFYSAITITIMVLRYLFWGFRVGGKKKMNGGKIQSRVRIARNIRVTKKCHKNELGTRIF